MDDAEEMATAAKLINALALFQIYLQEQGYAERIDKVRALNDLAIILATHYWVGVADVIRALFPNPVGRAKFLRSGQLPIDLCEVAVNWGKRE